MDSFYKIEFEFNTSLKIPKSGNIIEKDSDFPDFHGDFWAAMVFETDSIDHFNLKQLIKTDETFEIDTSNQKIGIGSEFSELTKGYEESNLDTVFLKVNEQWIKVAFLNDQKTIIFERCSW